MFWQANEICFQNISVINIQLPSRSRKFKIFAWLNKIFRRCKKIYPPFQWVLAELKPRGGWVHVLRVVPHDHIHILTSPFYFFFLWSATYVRVSDEICLLFVMLPLLKVLTWNITMTAIPQKIKIPLRMRTRWCVLQPYFSLLKHSNCLCLHLLWLLVLSCGLSIILVRMKKNQIYFSLLS